MFWGWKQPWWIFPVGDIRGWGSPLLSSIGGYYPGGINPGGSCPGGYYPGGSCPGGYYPGGSCPGGCCPGGYCPGWIKS